MFYLLQLIRLIPTMYTHQIVKCDINHTLSRQYKISVIVPVYNTGRYLTEAFESIIDQTIGFRDNIQLIIVNDGSTDSSRTICLRYKELYPTNVVYIEQTNSGVSVARNKGLEYIQGQYVTFFDSDDRWMKTAFEYMYSFFQKHESEVDVVCARMKMFEAWSGYPETDYKFRETAVISLLNNPSFIQTSPVSTFIKASVVSCHRFSEYLHYGEDTEFVNSILLQNCRLGVVREAQYLVRKRKDKSSALNNEIHSMSYLFDSPIYYHQALFDLSTALYGSILRFIQSTVMYEIKWRLTRPVSDFLSRDQNNRYISLIVASLQKIDDDIIMSVINTPIHLKILALCKKYTWDIRTQFQYRYGYLYFHSTTIYRLMHSTDLIKVISVSSSLDRSAIIVVFKDTCWLNSNQYTYILDVGSRKVLPNDITGARTENTMFGEMRVEQMVSFNIQISYTQTIKMKPYIAFKEINRTVYIPLRYGPSDRNEVLTEHLSGFTVSLNTDYLWIKAESGSEIRSFYRFLRRATYTFLPFLVVFLCLYYPRASRKFCAGASAVRFRSRRMNRLLE